MIAFNIYHIWLVLSCLVLAVHFYYRIYFKDGKPNKTSNLIILIIIANIIFNPFYIKNPNEQTIFPILIEAYLDIAFIVIVSAIGMIISKLIFKKYDKKH